MWFAADGHATFTALSEAKSSRDMMAHPYRAKHCIASSSLKASTRIRCAEGPPGGVAGCGHNRRAAAAGGDETLNLPAFVVHRKTRTNGPEMVAIVVRNRSATSLSAVGRTRCGLWMASTAAPHRMSTFYASRRPLAADCEHARRCGWCSSRSCRRSPLGQAPQQVIAGAAGNARACRVAAAPECSLRGRSGMGAMVVAGDAGAVAADVGGAPQPTPGVGEKQHRAVRVGAPAQRVSTTGVADQRDRLLGNGGEGGVAAEFGVPAGVSAHVVAAASDARADRR